MCFLGSMHAVLEKLYLTEMSSAHPDTVLTGTPQGLNSFMLLPRGATVFFLHRRQLVQREDVVIRQQKQGSFS